MTAKEIVVPSAERIEEKWKKKIIDREEEKSSALEKNWMKQNTIFNSGRCGNDDSKWKIQSAPMQLIVQRIM